LPTLPVKYSLLLLLGAFSIGEAEGKKKKKEKGERHVQRVRIMSNLSFFYPSIEWSAITPSD